MVKIKTLEEVKGYWETRLPQRWYSKKKEGTKEFYDEVEISRFSQFPYLYKDAEFESHAGEDVLEIGCGIGTESVVFARNKSNITAIDLTETAIKTTEQRFKLYGLKGVFKRMNAEKLEFPDNSFDYVYSNGVLHHTPDTFKAVEEVRRVLKPNKHASIFLYAKGWMYYIFFPLYFGLLKGELFKMSWDELVHKHYEMEGNVPIVRVYTQKGLKKLFRNYTKVIIKRRSLYTSVSDKYPNRWLIRQLEKIWGGYWTIKAYK